MLIIEVNHMKRVALFYAMILSVWCHAQSVTINHESAPVKYYRMPDKPLPPNYTTYKPDISIPYHELTRIGSNEATLIDQYLFLEGYRKVTTGGDVMIEAGISEFMIWGEHMNTRRSKSKDKDGNEQVKLSYSMEVKYSLPMSVRVTDKMDNTLLDRNIFTMSDTRTWTSTTYNNISDLQSYWRIQKKTRMADLQRDLMKEGLKKISDLINNQFGYKRIDDHARFEVIGKKKHPEYELYQKNVEIIKAGFRLMSADKSLEEVKVKINPALAFYVDAEKNYQTGSKDGERLKHLCLFNLALAYFWVENFDQARQYAQAIQKWDPKDKAAKKLLEEIDYVQSSLAKANRPSRHKIVVGGKT